MLGLHLPDPDTPALSQADVDGLATWLEMRSYLGEPVDGFLRVLGATMARLAEAESSMIRLSSPTCGWATPAANCAPPRRGGRSRSSSRGSAR